MIHLPPSCSDHIPILVEARVTTPVSFPDQRRRFRFEAMWAQEPSCIDVIKQIWKTERLGSQQYLTDGKMVNTRIGLTNWKRTIYGVRQEEINSLTRQLEEFYRLPFDPSRVSLLKDMQGRLSDLLGHAKTYWLQRSRTLWLRDGDHNTSFFFHQKASNR